MYVLTTGQVSKLLGVAPRTVSKWFDSGKLQGYRIPGSQDRRISLFAYRKFCETYDLPEGDIESLVAADMIRMLAITKDAQLIEQIHLLHEAGTIFGKVVETSFDMGKYVSHFDPHLVLIDFSDDFAHRSRISELLRFKHESIVRYGLAPSEANRRFLDRYVLDDTFAKPFHMDLLLERFRSVRKRKKK